jgi:carbon storage regulator
MLVLSRKEGQRIVIGGDIVITIVDTRAGRVRIGVEAPPHVSVHREEISQRIQSQQPLEHLSAATNESFFHAEFA